MRKMLVVCATVLCAVLSPVFAAWQPGLIQARISDDPNAANKAPSQWYRDLLETISEENIDFTYGTLMADVRNANLTNPRTEKKWSWTNYMTYAYEGQIFLEGDKTYNFYVQCDDGGAIFIDEQEVVNTETVSHHNFGRTGLHTPAATGWYDIRIYVWDWSGDKGPQANHFGIAYSTTDMKQYANNQDDGKIATSNQAWHYIKDDGATPTFLRYDDGKGFEDTLTIVGEPKNIGTVNPAYGSKTELSSGSSFDCSATSPVVIEGTTWTLAGYDVYDIDIATGERTAKVDALSGSGSSFTYTHGTTMRELVWEWAPTTHTITIGENAETVEGAGSHNHNAAVTLTATPSSSAYAFLKWTGDIPAGVDATQATISFTADRSYTLSPLYAAAFTVSTEGSDENNDGSPDKPFATIQKAIDRAVNGGKITVAAGTYYLDATLNVTNAVEIVGAGRDLTILSGMNIPDQRGVTITHGEATIRNLTVTGCRTEAGGSGIKIVDGTLVNVRVTGNEQYKKQWETNGGAGIYMDGGLVTNCVIDQNVSTPGYGYSPGVGIRMKGGLVVDSIVCSNKITRYQHRGLGIYMEGGTVRKCRIFGNYATEYGASEGHGIYMKSADALVDQCHVYSNDWNGVYIQNGTLQNSVIYGHRTTSGDLFSGVYLKNGTVRNNTIYGNVTVQDGHGKSGIHVDGGTAINNIIYGNGLGTLGSCYITGGTFKANVIDRMTANAVDCIVAEPCFVDAANFNFRLTNASPAIDAGTPVADYDYDLVGVKRPQRKGWDIGAYEIEETTEKVVNISAAETTVPQGAAITAEASLYNLDLERVSCTWTITGGGKSFEWSGDGANGIKLVYPSLPAGEYEVKLTVTEGEISYPSLTKVVFTVKPTTVFVDLNGSNDYPYSSAETAANSLSEAMDAVWQGSGAASSVHIAEGTYYLDKEISLVADIALYGKGRGKTKINGAKIENPVSSLISLSHEKAHLFGVTVEGCTNSLNTTAAGITMQNGKIADIEIKDVHRLSISGGKSRLALDMSGGLATNCFIHSLQANSDYGSANGCGLYMTGGTFVDGVIADINRTKAEYSGLGVYMSGGRISGVEIKNVTSSDDIGANGAALYLSGDNSLAENIIIKDCLNGAYVQSGTLRNALVVDNAWKSDRSAGIYQMGGKVYNCTAVGNSCATEEKNDFQITGGKAVNNIAMRALNTKGTFATNLVSVAVTNGTGIIVADPGFKNTRGKNAYRLKSRSPAINAGDNGVWSGVENPVDLDGNPRIYRAESNGVVDLGCFESGPLSGFSIILR